MIFFLMIRRPPRSTQSRSSAASDVYKRQSLGDGPGPLRDRALLELIYATGARISEAVGLDVDDLDLTEGQASVRLFGKGRKERMLSLIHISEPTRLGMISYAVFCLKKK